MRVLPSAKIGALPRAFGLPQGISERIKRDQVSAQRRRNARFRRSSSVRKSAISAWRSFSSTSPRMMVSSASAYPVSASSATKACTSLVILSSGRRNRTSHCPGAASIKRGAFDCYAAHGWRLTNEVEPGALQPGFIQTCRCKVEFPALRPALSHRSIRDFRRHNC
jgi:hypothetical protein